MDRTARNGATNNSEVSEKPRRRRFEAAYKLQVLEEAARYFRNQLREAPRAIAYLKGRGISGEPARGVSAR